MATITFSRTVTTAHQTRMVAALRDHYGMPTATAAQIQAEWERRVSAHTIGIVKDYERRLAKDAADGGVTDIALT